MPTSPLRPNSVMANPFAPPPLPPRPAPSAHRKPVPSLHSDLPGTNETAFLAAPTPRARQPPPLPPRPSPDTVASITYVDGNIPHHASLPPPPDNDEKTLPPRPVRRRWYYPSNKRLRYWILGLIVLLILLAIVAGVVAGLLKRKTSHTSAASASDNGGHPLSVEDGGVVKGDPGDIATFGNYSTNHFRLHSTRSIAVTRLDPIVNPDAVASHVHRIHGSSYFTQNLTSASQMQKIANCTTAQVQADKSAYWISQVYYRYPNGTLIGLEMTTTTIYYFMASPTGVPLYAFPDNYNIVAGDPYRRVYNSSDPHSAALWYNCASDFSGSDVRSTGFPTQACKGGFIQGIQFPSCWDGVYAEDGNYTAHVYFPKKFPTIQFETNFASYDYPFNGQNQITWVLSNGDTTGLGIHADFMNGWDTDVLQNALDNCKYMNATAEQSDPDEPANCPYLNSTIDLATTNSCRLQTPIVNEDVGQTTPLTYLPGCNGIWSGDTAKPACPGDHIEGGTLDLVEPSVWMDDMPYI